MTTTQENRDLYLLIWFKQEIFQIRKELMANEIGLLLSHFRVLLCKAILILFFKIVIDICR